MKKGKLERYPDLLASERISRFPPGLQFIEAPGEVPQAILGYSRSSLTFAQDELSFPLKMHSDADHNVVGAWDEYSFAIRVRTERYVKALRDFHAALRSGKIHFGSSFLERRGIRLSGVILVNSEYLTAEDREAIKIAQKAYESKLRLAAQEETAAITREMHQLMGGVSFGFLWPVWADERESGVHYGFNPGYRMRARYYGPYTKEELLAWAKAKGSYMLEKPRRAG